MNKAPQREGARKPATFRILAAEVKESFFMAMNALASHKLRSALTLLGVLVGVFSIIVVMTTMRAMRKRIELELDTLGGQTVVIEKFPGVTFTGFDDKYWRRKDITIKQGLAVKNRATLARSIGLNANLWAREVSSRFAKATPGVGLSGETPGSFSAVNWTIQEGRILLDSDVDGARDVCVLGQSLATTLFPHGSALNEQVKINGANYTVVGVLDGKGSTAGGDQDNFALLPITTGLNRYSGWRQSISILVQSWDADSLEDTVDQVRGILRAVRKVPPGAEDDFEVLSKDSLLNQLNSFTLAMRIGVSLVSSIALVAAGIGIMNIMLVSVTERTREIGIRRALGAKKRNIMTQFILEAVMLCEVGGAIGVVVGIGAGNLAGRVMSLPVVLPVDWILFGLGICSLVGIVFGTYPAYKAANLDPIESLRYE
jgi:putative ABC transport system permease protein